MLIYIHPAQYIKIFIAYLQVLGSFLVFQVTWPSLVGDTILLVQTVSNMIKIDLLEFPGLACPWVSYDYETKFHVSELVPCHAPSSSSGLCL